MIMIVGRRRWGYRSLRLGSGGRGTGRDKQGGEWKEATHWVLVAGSRESGKLVRPAMDR
jgi:hypothetical protein